jgi:hypothetical protein
MRRFVLLAAAFFVALLLFVTFASANVVPTEVTVKAPPVSTTETSASTYAGVNLSILAADTTLFQENVTGNPSIWTHGPVCIPQSQETRLPPFAYLSIYGSNDTVTLSTGDTCYASVDLGNFFWNFANASYAGHFNRTSYSLNLTGGTATGLALAYQNYMGQLRFLSKADSTPLQLAFQVPDSNLKDLNLTPVLSFSKEYSDPLTAVKGYSPAYGTTAIVHIPNGSFDTSHSYFPLPNAANTTFSGHTWTFTISASFCDIANIATQCWQWWGQAQSLFFSPSSVPPPPVGNSTTNNTTGLLCGTTGDWVGILFVAGISVLLILSVEYFGRR